MYTTSFEASGEEKKRRRKGEGEGQGQKLGRESPCGTKCQRRKGWKGEESIWDTF